MQLSILECMNCGLAWQYPLLRTADTSTAYFTLQYEEALKDTYFDKEIKKQIVDLELDFVHSVSGPPGRLLDVGAGDGTFITAAADLGWHCTGVDPAPSKSFQYMPRGQGTARLCQGVLGDLVPGTVYDVITMWDIIEHIEQPLELIESTVGLLAEDGILFVETGNYQSANRIEGGPRWWGFQADHRWYFSPGTLRPLLSEAGLDHVVLANNVFRPWWKGERIYEGPSRWQLTKWMLRSPFDPFGAIRRYKMLRDAAQNWREWAGLSIFTLAACRQPLPVGSKSNVTRL